MPNTTLIAGASRGIGLEMARQAKARGDHVIASVRSLGATAALSGIADEVLTFDITDEEQMVAAAETIGSVDLLVCNAGVLRGRGGMDAEDSGLDAWSDVLLTNVAGPFMVARAFVSKIQSPGGKIAIISSKMGSSELAPGNSYLYRASKAGATNVACNLAAELGPKGIAVGSYHPGWVRTDMGGSAADISVEESARGLHSRFDLLSMETTGVFETYEGEKIPF
jgi:NAD(P)-dependent dehydrogenase (short-subunit alcohol dehydrogenase family)